MHTKNIQSYETEIDAIKQELQKLPEGHLTKKGAYYYETLGAAQKGITKDMERVRQLARKAYLLRRLAHLEWNSSLTAKLSQKYRTEDPAEIIQGLPSFYRSLPVSCFFHSSVHGKAVGASEANGGYVDGLIYLTRSGVRVRSKSERTIADALEQREIPYRYEAALALGGASRYPDFTI